jgi:hypothetical protein
MNARPAVERVLSRISKEDRGHSTFCWVFQGSLTAANGYGQVCSKVDGVRVNRSTHRVVYEALVGPIGDGMTLDHLCEVKTCCNPDHLEPVTRLENIQRFRSRHADELSHCKYGHLLAETRRVTANGNSRCRACENRRSVEYYGRKKLSHNGTLPRGVGHDHGARG